MGIGGRNRVMTWTGTAIPYKPGKNDLLEATRRVGAVIASGGVVAIAARVGSTRARARSLPLSEGAAYFAMRSGRAARPDRHPRARAGCGSAAG